MSILRAGFARGEAFSILPRISSMGAVAALVLAGCTSPHPAPIVHRAPPGPIAAQPAPPAPATVPSPAAPAAAATAAPAAEAAENASGVETTPIARGPVETRPLPGVPSVATPPGPADAASANLLKTEPKALKQPYSDAALAQMRAAAPPPAASAAPVPPVASAAPSAATAASTVPQVPARVLEDPVPSAAPASAPAGGEWIWPASGQVVQHFAQPRSMGIAIAGKPGDPVVAVNDGRVIFSGAGPRSYGNLVIVKHGDETLSVYAHNRALLVKEGQNVKRGQRIAELGSSGTDSPKLHFEIRKDGRPVDPRKVLPAR